MTLFSQTKKQADIVGQVAYWTLVALIVILPVIVFTSGTLPLVMLKIAAAGCGVFLVLMLYALSRMKLQSVEVPNAPLLIAVWMIPLAYLFATLFSGDRAVSLFGERLSMDTFMYVAVGALVLSLAAALLSNQMRVLGVYVALLGAAVLLAVLQLVLFFGADMVAGLGFPSLSLLGTLNDLAVFFGLIVLFILLSLTLLPVTILVRVVLWVALACALFFLSVVDLGVMWWLLGMFALASLVYSIFRAFSVEGVSMRFSVAALVVFVVCGLFLYGPETVTSRPAAWANVGELDVRPSWGTTVTLAQAALAEHTLFGVGPGRFAVLWASEMPPEIQTTEFWNANFTYGIGYIPTSVITTGLLGAFAWLVFLLAFLYQGVRSLVLVHMHRVPGIAVYLRVTSFVAACYLWIIAFIQVPSSVLLLYAFLLTGVFVASITLGDHALGRRVLSFQKNPRVGFLATLGLTIAVLFSVGSIYTFSVYAAAESTYQEGLHMVSDVDDGYSAQEQMLLRAVDLHPTDAYLRALSTLDMLRLNKLLEASGDPEAVREQVQALLARAIGNGKQAADLDPLDYQNWQHLGNVYQRVSLLGIEGADGSAREAFGRALEQRPSSPQVYFSLGTLERAAGNAAEAQAHVEQSIALRGRYTEAIFLLAQMQLEAEDVPNALRSVEAVTVIEPTNPVAFFWLGLLRYGSNDFVGAAAALTRAVQISPEYANARYYLGLAQWRLNDIQRAIAEFEQVLVTNPNSTEVRSIISNLRAGRDPFESETASLDIQEQDGLPLAESENVAEEQEGDVHSPVAP